MIFIGISILQTAGKQLAGVRRKITQATAAVG
jgi:hypothetical protein